MNFLHATALALVGWYLSVPPSGADRSLVLDAPLKDWLSLEAFDRAQECEQQRSEFSEAAKQGDADLRKEASGSQP
jgi:hypothetical protein